MPWGLGGMAEDDTENTARNQILKSFICQVFIPFCRK